MEGELVIKNLADLETVALITFEWRWPRPDKITEKFLLLDLGSHPFSGGNLGVMALDDLNPDMSPFIESDYLREHDLEISGTFLRSDKMLPLLEDPNYEEDEASLVFKSLGEESVIDFGLGYCHSKEVVLFKGQSRESCGGNGNKMALQNFQEVTEGVGIFECHVSSGAHCFLTVSWGSEKVPKAFEKWYELLETPRDHELDEKERKMRVIERPSTSAGISGCPKWIQFLKSWETNTQDESESS